MKLQTSFFLLITTTTLLEGTNGFTSPPIRTTNTFVESKTFISAVPKGYIDGSAPIGDIQIVDIDEVSIQSQISDAVGKLSSTLGDAVGSVQSQINGAISQVGDLGGGSAAVVGGDVPGELAAGGGVDTTTLAIAAVIGIGGFALGTIAGGGNDERRLSNLQSDIKKKQKNIEAINTMLQTSQSENSQAKTEMEQRIQLLNNQIAEMDDEFKQGTGEIKKELEERVQQEIKIRGNKIEEDLKFSFDIRLAEEQKTMLDEKEQLTVTANTKERVLNKMRSELEEKIEARSALERSFEESQEEIEKLRVLKDMGMNIFEGIAMRTENSNMEKELSSLQTVLTTKEVELEQTQLEIEELTAKKTFFGFIAYIVKQKTAVAKAKMNVTIAETKAKVDESMAEAKTKMKAEPKTEETMEETAMAATKTE